jgi:hypothetical protein
LLAILGLYVQLAVAGFCTCGLPMAHAAPGVSPICHSQRTAERATKQAQNDRAPTHREQPCPFCMAHCHAAMVMAPSVAALDHVYVAAKPTQIAAYIAPLPPRFSLGAPPRGPPPSV